MREIGKLINAETAIIDREIVALDQELRNVFVFFGCALFATAANVQGGSGHDTETVQPDSTVSANPEFYPATESLAQLGALPWILDTLTKSHLINEFLRFSGVSPTDYLKRHQAFLERDNH